MRIEKSWLVLTLIVIAVLYWYYLDSVSQNFPERVTTIAEYTKPAPSSQSFLSHYWSILVSVILASTVWLMAIVHAARKQRVLWALLNFLFWPATIYYHWQDNLHQETDKAT